MDKRGDIELTPAEKAAFDNLPSEASPNRSLEDRIVRALKTDGTLKDTAPVSRRRWRLAPFRGSEVGGQHARMWPVAAGSIAASLLLFGGGLFVGQRIESRNTERILSAVREHDNSRFAERVQETGTAYVNALAALEKLSAGAGRKTGGNPEQSGQHVREIQQGREAALGALYGAAVELSRITPGDSLISQMLRIMEEQRFRESKLEVLKEGSI